MLALVREFNATLKNFNNELEKFRYQKFYLKIEGKFNPHTMSINIASWYACGLRRIVQELRHYIEKFGIDIMFIHK